MLGAESYFEVGSDACDFDGGCACHSYDVLVGKVGLNVDNDGLSIEFDGVLVGHGLDGDIVEGGERRYSNIDVLEVATLEVNLVNVEVLQLGEHKGHDYVLGLSHAGLVH